MSLKCQLVSSDYILAPTLLLYSNVKLSIFPPFISEYESRQKWVYSLMHETQFFYYLLIIVLFSIGITINLLFPTLVFAQVNTVTHSKLLSDPPLHLHLAFLKKCPCNSLTYSVLLCSWLSLFYTHYFQMFQSFPDARHCTMHSVYM